ncbi:sulfite exporter TauE/SafE family protein [Caldimonas tepidiphila]|uniref:sulfite exporter TauE/SafE family protein n=1 Tax=Caldimonas tepidiphila TaxID=2315841 RepID=UPI000E5A328D|nr:sulfite exporter TauE/SafE family protein [Caldimonas tepidiphila]
MEAWEAAAVGAVFVVAGGVKGVTGMGLPTVAVSLLGLWMTPLQAATLLVAPSLATNVAQCRGPHLRPLAATLWPVWIALALATVLAPDWEARARAPDARILLGVILVLYGAWGLWRPTLPQLSRSAHWPGAAVGGATGLVTAATAVFVIPLVPYLQALRLGKDEMVQALGLSFTVATLALAMRLQASGNPVPASFEAVLALVAAFAGMWLGTRLRSRISGAAFQRAMFVVFIGLGLVNLGRGA